MKDNLMEQQQTSKNVSNFFEHLFLETSGGQRSNLNLNVAHYFNTSVN
jgi:hypothetical protein